MGLPWVTHGLPKDFPQGFLLGLPYGHPRVGSDSPWRLMNSKAQTMDADGVPMGRL